jgi:arylformamidase
LASWIDVSVPLQHGLVPWPGDPPFQIRRESDVSQGNFCTFSTLAMSAHAGTHVDAPLHFIKNGRTVESMPIDAMLGTARDIPIRNRAIIDAAELRRHRIRRGERVLFKTRNSSRHRQNGKFFEDYVAVSPEAAEYLVSCGVRLVGIDGHSIGPFREGLAETHRILLGAGIWVIEFLDLRRAPAGPCDFICLPLRIFGADGAPARALLRPRSRAR